jgi:hypothetical protein
MPMCQSLRRREPTGRPHNLLTCEKLAYLCKSAITLALPMQCSGGMVKSINKHVLEISTPVFRVLRRRAPFYVAWSDERAGLTQRIVVDDDVYSEVIDRVIAKQRTIDEVFLEVGNRS